MLIKRKQKQRVTKIINYPDSLIILNIKYFTMLKQYFLFFTIIISGNILYGQNNNSELNNLKILFEKLKYSKNDTSRDSLNTIIASDLKNYISDNAVSELQKIKNLSVLISEDKKVSILTWPILYSDFTYKFFGFVRYYEPDFGRYTVEKLKDNSDKIVNPERQILNPDNWYGAFYYKMVYKKYKKNKIYVLLGWDGNNDMTNRKIIDVFYSDENEEPVFGKNIFNSQDGIKKRLIFEYKEGISMNLRYDEKKDMIIWDHLSPSKPSLKGHFEYYGPDLTFDALFFEKGIWNYIPDVNLSK